MDKVARALEVLERAANLGLRMEFLSGVNVLRMTRPVDPEVITFTVEQLVEYLPEVRAICQRRAIRSLAKDLVGQRIYSKEYGAGTLIDASEDGALAISISSQMRKSHEEESRSSMLSITSNAESLLILDETQPKGALVLNDSAVPEQPKTGFFGRLRRGSREE